MESSLHAAIKQWYSIPGDLVEETIDGYVIDIVRGGKLIEVQTGNFAAIREKIKFLLSHHVIRIVYPIAVEKWVLRIGENNEPLVRRKSPKKGRLEDLFKELAWFPSLVLNPWFSLDVIIIQEEVVWQNDGRGSWRRKGWSIVDHRLLSIMSNQLFENRDDFLRLLPEALPQYFTSRDLATSSRIHRPIASKMLYCLREMGAIQVIGKKGNSLLYSYPN